MSQATAPFTITVTDAPVDSQLTLILTPSTAEPSTIVLASGYLTRQDTGVPVGGATIDLYDGVGTYLGSAVTDLNGYFEIQFTAPGVAGAYIYNVQFLGGDF